MTQLHLAVEIADVVLQADQGPDLPDIKTLAAYLAWKHPEAKTSFAEVADTLTEEFCASL